VITWGDAPLRGWVLCGDANERAFNDPRFDQVLLLHWDGSTFRASHPSDTSSSRVYEYGAREAALGLYDGEGERAAPILTVIRDQLVRSLIVVTWEFVVE
jgi:hypothetical protein